MSPSCSQNERIDNLEQAQKDLAGLLGPHHLELVTLDSDYICHLTHANLGNLNLGYLLWQRAFQLEQKQPESLYIIYLVLEGSITLRIMPGQIVYCSPDKAAIVNPGQNLVALASERGQSLLVCIERNLVEQALATLLGCNLKQPVVFEPELDLTHQLGHSLKQFLEFLWQMENGETVPSSLVVEEFEQAFLACLVKGLSHNYSESLLYQDIGASACYVQKAQAFIKANIQADIRLEDMAAAVGVSPRMLEKAFAHHSDCPPMRFLKRVRLDQVRQELEQAISQTKVMDVMNRYGFFHGGKFAEEYCKRFGETPSATLKRCQRSNRRNK